MSKGRGGIKRAVPVKGTSPKVSQNARGPGTKYTSGESGRVKPANLGRSVRRRRNP